MLSRLLRLFGGSRSAPTVTPGPSQCATDATDAANLRAEAERLRKEGNARLAEGRLEEAVGAYSQAIACAPHEAALHVNLGFALKEQGRLEEASAPLARAAALDPQSFDARYLHGLVLAGRGDAHAAIGELQAALALRPNFTAGHSELSRLLLQTGRIDQAKARLHAALQGDPEQAALHLLLGNLHAHSQAAAEATACYRRALALQPDFAEAHSNLGLVLEQQGLVSEAVAAFRTAIALAPDHAEARSNLLFSLSYDPQASPADYLAEARRCGTALMARAKPYTSWPAAHAATDGPMRVGVLSGGLRMHPIGYFLESLLGAWDSSRMTLHAYSANPLDDALTERLRPQFAQWRSVALASDADVARLVHEDGVHILIDLSGHTDHSRVAAMCWKPAPVQVSWLGFFATTGLEAIDWFLADPVSVPPAHEGHFTERVWRLPHTRLCFTPPVEGPSIGPLPALRAGHVTFGCFQRLPKINDALLRTWARVMDGVPSARLRLQSAHLDDAGIRADFLRRCDVAGLDPSRVDLHETASRESYLDAHNEVDLLLDTLPYTGATTTCEALWMGVPTLTMAGDRLIARQGASLMACLDLDDWVANDLDDYVVRACRLAFDLRGLERLRADLRPRLLASPLCDSRAMSFEVQAALHSMWQERVTALQTHVVTH